MTPSEYIDKAKEKLELTSDYALSLSLEVDRKRISRYRNNESFFDDYMTFKIAEILKISPEHIICDMKSQSEKNEDKREFWLEQLKKSAGAVVLGGVILGASSSDVHASISSMNSSSVNPSLYIMLKRLLGKIRKSLVKRIQKIYSPEYV